MCGKSWLAGQNWIDQFICNCARAGHNNLIGRLTNGQSAYALINDPDKTFPESGDYIGDNSLWVDREYVAKREEYKMAR